MADKTIVAKDSSYRSHLSSLGGDDGYYRAEAVNAAVELLHAAALGGAYNSAHPGEIGANMGKDVGPLADAIETALKASRST